MAITVVCQGLLVPMPAQIGVESDPSGLTLRSLIFDHLSSQSEPGLVEALFDDGGLKPGYAGHCLRVQAGDVHMFPASFSPR